MDYAMQPPWSGRGFAHMFGAAMNDGTADERPPRGRSRRHGGPGHGRSRSGFGPGPLGPEGFGKGPGQFGAGPSPFGPGPRRGGRARRGEVRNAALLLIAEEPRNGYQIIQELETRSDGRWKPSPGAVYPALSQLEDEGLIRQVPTDTGKLFEVTEAGAAEAERTPEPGAWGQEDDATVATDLMRAASQAWQALGAVAQSGDDDVIGRATAEVEELRRRLYQLLAES